MNELELMLVCSIIAGVPYLGIYLSHKRSIKRIKEKLSQPTIDLDEGVVERVMPVLETEELYGITDTTYRGWSEYDNRNNPMPLRERYRDDLEEKEDFIPKKRIRAHKLEKMGPLTKSGRPDMRYSANRGDRGNIADDFMEDESGPTTVCDDYYEWDNQYPF